MIDFPKIVQFIAAQTYTQMLDMAQQVEPLICTNTDEHGERVRLVIQVASAWLQAITATELEDLLNGFPVRMRRLRGISEQLDLPVQVILELRLTSVLKNMQALKAEVNILELTHAVGRYLADTDDHKQSWLAGRAANILAMTRKKHVVTTPPSETRGITSTVEYDSNIRNLIHALLLIKSRISGTPHNTAEWDPLRLSRYNHCLRHLERAQDPNDEEMLIADYSDNAIFAFSCEYYAASYNPNLAIDHLFANTIVADYGIRCYLLDNDLDDMIKEPADLEHTQHTLNYLMRCFSEVPEKNGAADSILQWLDSDIDENTSLMYKILCDNKQFIDWKIENDVLSVRVWVYDNIPE